MTARKPRQVRFVEAQFGTLSGRCAAKVELQGAAQRGPPATRRGRHLGFYAAGGDSLRARVLAVLYPINRFLEIGESMTAASLTALSDRPRI
jgi:hypothetical protein